MIKERMLATLVEMYGDTEQLISELKKETLKSYSEKAEKDLDSMGRTYAYGSGSMPKKVKKKLERKLSNRMAGIDSAKDRLGE